MRPQPCEHRKVASRSARCRKRLHDQDELGNRIFGEAAEKVVECHTKADDPLRLVSECSAANLDDAIRNGC
jgi:hypothetical protein